MWKKLKPVFDLVLVVNNVTDEHYTFEEFVTQTQRKGYARVGCIEGLGRSSIFLKDMK